MSEMAKTAVTEVVVMGLEVLSDVTECDSSADDAAAVLELVQRLGLRSVLEAVRDAAHAARDAHDGDGHTEACVIRGLTKFSDAMTFAIQEVE